MRTTNPPTDAASAASLLICGERIALSGRACGRCEYFDLGTMDAGGESDCLNRLAPRFQTRATYTCQHWMQST